MGVKCGDILVATMVGALLSYDLLVRRFSPVSFLVGMKPKPKPIEGPPVPYQMGGHGSGISITANTYVHLQEGQRRGAVDALGDLITGRTSKAKDKQGQEGS